MNTRRAGPALLIGLAVAIGVLAMPKAHTRADDDRDHLTHNVWTSLSHRTGSTISSQSVLTFSRDGIFTYTANSRIHSMLADCPAVAGGYYSGRGNGVGTWKFANDGSIVAESLELMRDANGNGIGRFVIKFRFVMAGDQLVGTFKFVFTNLTSRTCDGLGLGTSDPSTDLIASGTEALNGAVGSGENLSIPLAKDPVFGYVPEP
jgi:hypothetical protein